MRKPSPLPRAALAVILFTGFSFISIFVSEAWKAGQSDARSDDGVWQVVEENTITSRPLATRKLRSYRVARLDSEALVKALSAAPFEFTNPVGAPTTLSLPMPDGSFSRFKIEESPVMENELAAQFPQVKTYRGQGLDDPSSTARLGWTPLGFHAIALTSRGTIVIDNYAPGDTVNYVSFYLQDLEGDFSAPQCLVTEAMRTASALSTEIEPEVSTGPTLRTYRLAIATTVEYTNNPTYGGNESSTLTKLGTIVNLINAIYERDTAIHFNLVAGELSIIFESEPDGYTNGDLISMLNANPGIINAALPGGAANYDIGHVFGLSTMGGSSGVSQVGVVCGSATSKAKGASLLGVALTTGNFNIDSNLVAHEFGHQFNANHTFNSTSGICGSSGQRNASTAYEPGSGSTVMAYPGLCAPENLQTSSNSYFHSATIDEIVTYSTNTATCAATTATGNDPPVISAGPDYTIPAQTPFKLTATGSDPNGDTLTYCWEEFDLGSPSPPMTDGGGRPLFRSFTPVADPSRTFPKLSDILNNTMTIGETLPTTPRTLTFRVTARDNRASAGGVNSDSTSLSVSAAAGPFSVSQPNSALSWPSGSLQTVTWAVANTNISPVNTPTVRILLSTDAGLSFPVLVAASTPNDGSHPFFVPNLPTSSARIKVEAVSNIFFDISNSNFTITQSCPASLDSFSQSFAANGGSATIQVTAAAGCNWTANSSDTSVVTVTSGGAGTGNGQIGLTISANATTNTRSATITIGSLTFTVLQGVQFSDVAQNHLFYNEIGKLSARGITAGCGGGAYCPEALVTREQMAAFIIRAMGDFNPPQPGSQRFADVPATNPFYAFIEQMAVRQITAGCGGGNYCPSAAVTREQMAVFIIRGIGEYNPPTPAMQRFNDVPPTSLFYAFIDRMAALGITSGCSTMPPLYCPTAGVTRGQMAVFLVRAFNL
jgi:reprolysin-like metallo-peptidase family M12B/S-layer family protein